MKKCLELSNSESNFEDNKKCDKLIETKIRLIFRNITNITYYQDNSYCNQIDTNLECEDDFSCLNKLECSNIDYKRTCNNITQINLCDFNLNNESRSLLPMNENCEFC